MAEVGLSSGVIHSSLAYFRFRRDPHIIEQLNPQWVRDDDADCFLRRDSNAIRRLYGRMRTRTERPPHSVKIADESTRATMRIENNDNPIRKIRGVRGVPQKLPREGQCTVHSSRRFPIQHSRFPGSNCAEPMRESPLDCAGFFTFCQYDNCRGGSSQARTDRMDWERGIRLRSRRGRHQAAAGNEFADFDGGRWTIGSRLHSYL